MRRHVVPFALLAVVAGGAAPAAAAPEACPEEVRTTTGTNPTAAMLAAEFERAAAAHRVPVAVLKGIGWMESGWRQFDAAGRVVISTDHVCGVGIMQVTADGRDDAALLASSPAYNIDQGARILAEKWEVAAGTPPPTGYQPDDPLVHENWYYAACLYNGCGSDPAYPDRVAEIVADPFRRVDRAYWSYLPPAGLTKPTDADPAYDFPAAFQAQYAPEQRFVFYDHMTGVVTKTVAAPTHDVRVPIAIRYPVGTYGPDGPHVHCDQCGGWRLAEGRGLAGRAHWTDSVLGADRARVHCPGSRGRRNTGLLERE